VPAGSSSNIEKEGIPKSMMRVLNAAEVREAYRRKRKCGGDSLDGHGRPEKRQKTNAEENLRGIEDKGTLVIKVCRVDNLKAPANL
jgi:Fe-S oxidoreductase